MSLVFIFKVTADLNTAHIQSCINSCTGLFIRHFNVITNVNSFLYFDLAGQCNRLGTLADT